MATEQLFSNYRGFRNFTIDIISVCKPYLMSSISDETLKYVIIVFEKPYHAANHARPVSLADMPYVMSPSFKI